MSAQTIDDSVISEIKSKVRPSDLIGQFVTLKRSGKEHVGLSPFSKEKTPSFTVNDDKGFYHCFSSGKHGDVIDFLVESQGMAWRDAVEKLATDTGTPISPPKPAPKPTIVCHYDYEDQTGKPYLRVTRLSDKSFRQSHWNDIDECWQTGKPSGPAIPYRLPDILTNPDQIIHLVEGEKAADFLTKQGLLATTAPGGGTAFPLADDFAVWFDGQRVRAYPDNDATGQKWAERVSQRLPHAEIVWLPDQAPKAGADDWLQRDGRKVDDLIAAVSVASDEFATDTAKETAQGITPTSFLWVDPKDIPNRNPLYGTHLFRKFVSITISPGGIGKSSLVMMESLCMASNRPLLGDKIYGGPLKVWYWNGEDPQDENSRRVIAAAIYHGIKAEEFSNRLWMDSGRQLQIKLAEMAKGGAEINEEIFLAIEHALIQRGIDVLVIDPLVSAHSIPENDNGAMDAVVKRLGIVAERANCAIELVHHTRKPSGGTKNDTEVADARGAGAIIAGVRSARMLNPMSKEEAGDFGIHEDEVNSYFRVDYGKANLAKRSADHAWRHLVSKGLGNETEICPEDKVGVVEEYKAPKTSSRFPEDAAVQAQRIAESRLNLRHWSSGPAPSDWFGFAVIRAFDMHEVDDKAAMRRMIATWIKSGILKVAEGYENRNDVKYIHSTRPVVTGDPVEETRSNDPF